MVGGSCCFFESFYVDSQTICVDIYFSVDLVVYVLCPPSSLFWRSNPQPFFPTN